MMPFDDSETGEGQFDLRESPGEAGRFPIRRWQAPRQHGMALIDPPLADVPSILRQNQTRLDGPWSLRLTPFTTLRDQSRRDLLDVAMRHTRAYRDDLPDPDFQAPLLLAGHQPELFHPGVWLKNFVLSRLAETQHATAVNLLIDNDALRIPTIRVPTGSIESPQIVAVDFDRPMAEVAFEDRPILDWDRFASFGQRVADTIAPLVPNPLIREFWPRAMEAGRATGNVGLALAIARHQTERQAGLATWEAPLSSICETDSFRRFVCEVLVRHEQLHAIYNESLAEYRRVHRIRSQTHPVPELLQADAWHELPFWIWHREAPERRRLYVRRQPAGIELSDRRALRCVLQLCESRCDPLAACEQLAAWSAAGVRLRPRALVTTMYARLLLSDLFMHGIGGGKYDQLTDMILARFFGIEPPIFLVATATAQLPIESEDVEAEEVRRAKLDLRRLWWNPEQHVANWWPNHPLVEDKRRWLATELPQKKKWQRHGAIQEINERLRPWVESVRAEQLAKLDFLQSRRRSQTLLRSREFAFCLFPAESLLGLLLALSQEPS